jgi:hypothetical protein
MNRFGKKSDNTLMKLFSYVHYLHYFIDFEWDQQKKIQRFGAYKRSGCF